MRLLNTMQKILNKNEVHDALSEMNQSKIRSFCNDNLWQSGTYTPRVIYEDVYKACQNLLKALVIDTENDPNTRDTASRMARMYLHELFVGRYTPMPNMTAFPNEKHIDQLIASGPIQIKSMCAHHFMPFIGHAWIGVLPDPDGLLLGLSKYARLTHWIFRRPTIQEESTEQLASKLEEIIKPHGLAVVVRAKHMCECMRGVEEPECMAVTTVLKGNFLTDPKAKSEFFDVIKGMGY